MSQPAHQITAWADYGAMYLCNHAKAVATQAKLHMQDRQTFFSQTFASKPKTSSDKNLLCPA